jgi:glycosyltransferase involved in cell wall biosynthesis
VRVTAVIPTLNEEKTIAEVVRGCLPHVNEVLVVDGGSTDATCAVASAHGARVICLGQRGLGKAKQHVIATETADILLFLDADGSHRPADIPRLLAPLLDGQADLVIGCRATGGSDEWDNDHGHLVRFLGTKGLQWLFNCCLHGRQTDLQNGFRAIRADVARDLGLKHQGYCIDQEMAVRCLQKGCRVVNVPSREERRRHGHSRFSLWRVAPQFAWNAFSLLVLHGFPAPFVRRNRSSGERAP